MQRKTRWLMSICLLLVMMLSLLPLQAFAESPELTDEQTTTLPSDESLEEEVNPEPLILPDGQTIILSVVENTGGEEKNFPKEKKNNEQIRGLMGLFSTNINTVYAPTGVNSYYINGRIYLDTTVEPVSGAVLQVLAADGETVLANTPGIDQYYKDYDTGYYYVSYKYITLLQEITAGTYSIQLVAGQEKIPALTNIEFTDQPFLASVDLNSFYVGSDTCEVYVIMYNSSETQLEQLMFSLLDSNDVIVGQTSGLYRQLRINNNERSISGYTLMNISGSVSQDEDYRLAVTYSGAGTLCDGTGGIASFSHYPSSYAYPEITNLEVTDARTSELIVYVDNLQASSSYILTIRDGYYGKILHQSTVDKRAKIFVGFGRRSGRISIILLFGE